MRPDPLIGSELAGYRIEELIGRGGMGVVYRAEHLLLGRQDAVKLLSPELAEDSSFRERFLRESRLAASIDHPNIVPIYHAGEMDGLLFIAMRYVEGTDLRTMLREQGRLDPARTLSIVEQVASALDTAHSFNLVHRDVKPGNILIATGDRVYLTDFGIAKHTKTRGGLTQTGSFLGTLDYAAPEQIEGKDLDGRADVYSLACVLFQCLSGRPPFEKDTEVQLIYAHLLESPPPITASLPTLPPGLDTVVARALAKPRDERYQSAGELAAALRAEFESRVAPTRIERPRTAEAQPAPPPAPSAPPAPPPAEQVLRPPPPAAPPPAEPAFRPRRWSSPGKLAAAGALVVAAAVLAFVALSRGGEGGAFPDEAEERLLALVPSSVRPSCTRADEPAPEGGAALACSSGGQQVTYVSFPRRPALDRRYASRLPSSLRTSSGSCSERPLVGERPYTVEGRRAGRLFCGPDDGGALLIGWTDESRRVYAEATRGDDDRRSLYRWWQRSAGPLPQAGGSVQVRRELLPAGAVLFREDFSNRDRAWSVQNDARVRVAYADGGYAMRMKRAGIEVLSTTAAIQPSLSFEDARVEVSAAGRGSGSQAFGVVCRFTGAGESAAPSFYAMAVRLDGVALIRRSRRGRDRNLVAPKNFSSQLFKATNRVAGECAGASGGTVQLRLFLNGQLLLAARDRSPLGTAGAAGVIATSGSRKSAGVTFDRFLVTRR